MSKLSKSLRTAGGLTSRVGGKSLTRPSLVQASSALNQRQSGAFPSTQDCNLTYSEYKVPPSMYGTAGPPRSSYHKLSRDESTERAWKQGLFRGDADKCYGAQDPDVPTRVPKAGPASLYDPTATEQAGDAATETYEGDWLNEGRWANSWLSEDEYEQYQPRLERLRQAFGPLFPGDTNFAALCKATDGWDEDEVGDLLAEARALRWIAQREAVPPDEYPSVLAAQLDVEKEWVHNNPLSHDGMLAFMPANFDWWNSETYRSVTRSRMQRSWANQPTT